MKINWHQPFGQTCRITINSGEIYGAFYDSKSSLCHIAEFIPNKKLPNITLCGNRYVNFSAVGTPFDICPHCKRELEGIVNSFGTLESKQ